MLSVSETINNVVVTGSSFPQHDTTEVLGVHLHVGGDQGLSLIRGQVVSRVSSVRGGGQTDVELSIGVRTGLDNLDPPAEVKVAVAIDPVAGRAVSGVVELDPDKVEDGVLDSIAQLGIGDGALRSTGDVHLLLGVLVVVGAQAVDHGSPSY
jgi:hypothetical protein